MRQLDDNDDLKMDDTVDVEKIIYNNDGDAFVEKGGNWKHIIGKIFNTLGWTVLGMGLLVVILTVLMNYSNVKPMYVVSDSMVPTFKTGDLILVSTAPNSVDKGDIIAYHSTWLDGKTVTHRVVSHEDGVIIAKGDNNQTNDPKIDPSAVVGEVVGIAPNIGFIFQKTTMWILVVFGILSIWSYETFLKDKVFEGSKRRSWWRKAIPVGTVETIVNRDEHDVDEDFDDANVQEMDEVSNVSVPEPVEYDEFSVDDVDYEEENDLPDFEDEAEDTYLDEYVDEDEPKEIYPEYDEMSDFDEMPEFDEELDSDESIVEPQEESDAAVGNHFADESDYENDDYEDEEETPTYVGRRFASIEDGLYMYDESNNVSMKPRRAL